MTAETPHPAEGRRLGPIDRADFITVRLPFVAPFGTSIHTWSVKEALLLRLEASGVVGWGETIPNYTWAKVPDKIAERVVGREADRVRVRRQIREPQRLRKIFLSMCHN